MTAINASQLAGQCRMLNRVVTVAVVFGLGISASAFATDELHFGGPRSPLLIHLSFEDVSHAQFDALLSRYVDCVGMVCYSQWRAKCNDVRILEVYLDSLAQVDPSLPARREARMAFYINAYNAMTLWGILREYPVVSVQRIDGKRTDFSIFDDLMLWDGESYRSLNGIENDVLRPLNDSRIHFALVCAARGCPRLRNRAYNADTLHWQLDDNACEFFSSHSKFHVSPITGKVRISPILEWYRDDFGQTDHQVISTVLPYLSEQDQRWLSSHGNWRLQYLGYDWSLNDRCQRADVRLGAIPYRAYSKISPALEPMKAIISRIQRNATDRSPASKQ